MRRHAPPLALLTVGLVVAMSPASRSQAIPPPNPDPNAQPRVDLNNVTHQMAERVRHLAEDVASDLGGTPAGRHLLEDVRELAASVDEFHESLHNVRDPYQLRQAYTGIDQTWHHLKSQLVQPGVASPAVDRAAQRVD